MIAYQIYWLFANGCNGPDRIAMSIVGGIVIGLI